MGGYRVWGFGGILGLYGDNGKDNGKAIEDLGFKV